MEATEIVGIAASVLVLVSFLFKNIRTIRLISIVGCIIFVVYGVLINAPSIWLLNGILIFVHIFFLIKMRKNKGTASTTSTAEQSTEIEITLPTMQPTQQTHRLRNHKPEAFNKKGLRSLPWFVTSDME